MGYNIGEVTGYGGGPSEWSLTVDLTDPSATTVSGDFDVVSLLTGGSTGEADDYSIIGTSANFDTYTDNFVLNADGTFSFDIDRAAVFASDANQTVSFTILGTSGGQSDDDQVSVTLLICVARGTEIRTANGRRPVETLQPGDWIPTLDNGSQPIRWIGSRLLEAEELRRNPQWHPIRIKAGALGRGRPRRDLRVSPQHRVLLSDWRAQLFFGVDEILVPAKGLVDGQKIRWEQEDSEIEYFHILFDTHQVIYTEGSLTESFHPTGFSLRGVDPEARAELLALFPELDEDDGTYGPAAKYVAKVQEGLFMTQTTAV
jgi:Hint domain